MSEELNNQKAQGAAALHALAARVAGDRQAAIDAIDVIFDGGDVAMYAAMCAWAEAVKLLSLDKNNAGGHWYMEVSGPGDEPVNTAPRGTVFAVRFLTAWANGDRDMTRDMYFSLRPTEADAEICAGAMIGLLDMAADAIVVVSGG